MNHAMTMQHREPGADYELVSNEDNDILKSTQILCCDHNSTR